MNYFLILAFGAMVCWGVGDFLMQRMSRALGEAASLIWINLLGGIMLTPFIINDFSSLLHLKNIVPLLILSVLDMAYGLAILKAYTKGKLSVVEVVLTAELPFVILLGVIFFHERPSVIQLLLMAMIISGILLISRHGNSLLENIYDHIVKKSNYFEKGLALALIAAFASALYSFALAYNAKELPPIITVWFAWTSSFIWLAIFFTYQKGFKKLFANAANHKKLILSGSIIQTTAWIFYAFALKNNDLSITTAITESYLVIAMFLGVKFNNEKISKLQYLGAAIALAGSTIMALVN